VEALNIPDVIRLARMERRDDAVAELRRYLDADLVWRVSMFDTTAATDFLSDPRVLEMVAEARRRMEARHFAPAVLVKSAVAPGLRPLLLVLHGARGSAALELAAWWPAARLGYIVAAGQSSQPSAPGLFCWDPPLQRIRQDLVAIAADLPRHGRVVLAGFSQVAWLALGEALRGDLFQASAVLLVAPFVGDLNHLPPAARRLRVHLLAGADDPYSDRIELLEERLRELGHHVAVDVLPNHGHAYPPDFEARIPALLESVTRRS
jgi:predicted esterase